MKRKHDFCPGACHPPDVLPHYDPVLFVLRRSYRLSPPLPNPRKDHTAYLLARNCSASSFDVALIPSLRCVALGTEFFADTSCLLSFTPWNRGPRMAISRSQTDSCSRGIVGGGRPLGTIVQCDVSNDFLATLGRRQACTGLSDLVGFGLCLCGR